MRNRFFNLYSETRGKRNFFVTYTLLFLIIFSLSYFHFFINGKSLIWAFDGFNQHLPSLVYYAQWMREILKHLIFDHNLSIPTWSFSLGYGSDILTSLHYYCIGDPFALPVIFFPTSLIPLYMEVSAVVRLYFAGLAFAAFCFQKKTLDPWAILVASFVYTFSSFAMINVVRHPFFLTPMVLLPLLLIGVDRILKGKKPWLFTFMVFLSAISNFYFFYMIVLLTVIYVFCQLLIPVREIKVKETLASILRLASYGLVGLMLAAFLFLPILLFLFGDHRSEVKVVFDTFYPVQYYESFLSAFLSYGMISKSNWGNLGYAAISLPALLFLFMKDKKTPERQRLRFAFLLMTGFLMLPVIQHILNGFSYPSSRWHFGYSLLIAMIVAHSLPAMMEDLPLMKLRILFSGLILYIAACILLDRSRTTNVMFSLTVALIFASMLVFGQLLTDRKRRYSLIRSSALLLTIVSIAGNALFGFSPLEKNYVAETLNQKEVKDSLHPADASLIRHHTDQAGFSRYTSLNKTLELSYNGAMTEGLYSTGFYLSLQNSSVSKAITDLAIANPVSFKYSDPNRRTILENLASVRYILLPSKRGKAPRNLPFGYVYKGEKFFTKENGEEVGFCLYENAYALPFAYTYDKVLPKDYQAWTPFRKQEAMLYGAFLEGYQGKTVKTLTNPPFKGRKPPLKMRTNNSQISIQGNSFVVTKPGASVTLLFEGLPNSETYLSIKNLHFEGVSKYNLYQGDDRFDPLQLYGGEKNANPAWEDWNLLSRLQKRNMKRANKYFVETERQHIKIAAKNTENKVSKTRLTLQTDRFLWYNGQDDYLINLFYDEAPKNKIKLTFPKRGIYSFDSIQLLCQPMTDYPQQMDSIKEDVLQNLDFHQIGASTNHISGTIKLKENKILCLSIPYTEGWKAKVDGKERPLYKTNSMYTGLPLTAGQHQIELYYTTPGIKAGIAISFLAIVILFLHLIWDRSRGKESKKNK